MDDDFIRIHEQYRSISPKEYVVAMLGPPPNVSIKGHYSFSSCKMQYFKSFTYNSYIQTYNKF